MTPQTVVITGASSGIGRCTAGLFAQRGWRVGLIARSGAGLQATRADVERHGAAAALAQADVGDADRLDAAAASLDAALGPIDAWVNCAGNATYGRFTDTTPEQFDRVTAVTYLGTVNGTRAALRHMMPRDRGRIVNVCSAIAFHGLPLMASYSGAKQAVRGFGQAVRAELRQDGSRVSVTTVFPPAVNTPFFDHALSHMGRPSRPLPPVYQPEVVAEAIYLAAATGCPELLVSFTTVLFSLGTRLCPGLVGRAIRRLGYDGQLSDHAASHSRYAPTLFDTVEAESPIRGAFDTGARHRSLQLRIARLLAGRGRSIGSGPDGTRR